MAMFNSYVSLPEGTPVGPSYMISVGYEHMQSVDPRCSLGALEMESTGVWHSLGRCPRSCQRSGLVRLELQFHYGIYRWYIYSFHGFITNTLLTLLMEVGKKNRLDQQQPFRCEGLRPWCTAHAGSVSKWFFSSCRTWRDRRRMGSKENFWEQPCFRVGFYGLCKWCG